MATEAALPLNGNYGTPSNASSQPASLTNGGAEQTGSAASPPKDEVGWYFVEQYYTTMSRSPDKVHLFYNKRSQFVYGVEAEKVPVSVGQRAISERISELGIEDCKVRVTNVDSQESGKSIVLQVVGEMSVKGQPHRKFVQTFVLAEQPNGYFVLNDIFRYIADEPEDDDFETSPEEAEVEAAAEPEPETESAAAEVQADIKTLTSSDILAEQAKDAEIVDKKLEDVASEKATAEVAPVPQVAASVEEPAPEPEATEKAPEPEALKAEVPKDPTPSPVATPASTSAPAPAAAPTAPAASQPAKEAPAPAKPAAPKTWASMLAGNKAPVPALPLQQSNQAQAKPAVAAAPAPVAAPAAATAAATEPAAAAPAQVPSADTADVPASPGGWQTAGADHSKKQNRAQAGGNVNGYIKNVTANIEAAALKAALSKHGELSYFDISRPKNCAFVEFKTPEGYNKAVAANPHKVNGEDIILEERRPRPQNFNQNFRGGMRGNRNSIDGRTPSTGGRGGFKDNRGGFVPRGRGAAGRGRGGVGQDA